MSNESTKSPSSNQHQFENPSLNQHQFENPSKSSFSSSETKNHISPVMIDPKLDTPKPIFTYTYDSGPNNLGWILIDTGASVSLINESELNKLHFAKTKRRTKTYMGASGSTLNLADYLVDIEINIAGAGNMLLKDVVVCKGTKRSNTILMGGPDIHKHGLVLNYYSNTVTFTRQNLIGTKLKMPTMSMLRQQNVIFEKFSEFNLNIIFEQLINMISTEDPENIQSKHVLESDNLSNKATLGDPCHMTKSNCSGCTECIDERLQNLTKTGYLTKISQNPKVDNKSVLMSYIESIRKHDQETYTHEDITYDPDLVKNDPKFVDEIRNLFLKYKKVFSSDIGCLGSEYTVNGTIKDSQKISPQRPGHSKLEGNNLIALLKQVSQLAAHGIIRPCHEVGVEPKQQLMMLLVKKKDDDGKIIDILQSARIVVNSQPVNSKTKFTGVRTDNLPDALAFAIRASEFGFNLKCDVANAFFLIPLHPDLWPYFCINIPILGMYCFVRVVQGWSPAAQICQDAMTRLFFSIHENFRKYMDDGILATKPDKNEYLSVLEHFLNICLVNGVKLKGSKCFVHVKKFNYLGHRIENGTLKASPHYVLKIKKIKYIEIDTKTKLKSFVYQVRWLAQFLNRSSELLKPLNDASSGEGNEKVIWSKDLILEFEKVQLALNDLCELYPYNPELESIIVVDSSKTATGGFLYQKHPNGPRLISFFSRTQKSNAQLISSCHLEFLGLKSLIYAFLPLLSQSKLTHTVITDSRGVVKIFDRFRRGELPSNDTILNNALYSIASVLNINAIHAKAANQRIKFADDMSRLGLFVSKNTCVGQPSCTICAAADPNNQERAIINCVKDLVHHGRNISQIFEPLPPIFPPDKTIFKIVKLKHFDPINNVQDLKTKYNLRTLLEDSQFILDEQLKDKKLKTLYNNLKDGTVSFPKSKQPLQTLLETRRAKIENGYIKIDKVIDGVVHRVVPIPNSTAIVAISATHNSFGHTSMTQLTKQVQKHFQFEHIKDKVRDFSLWCTKCALHQGGGKFLSTNQKPVPIPTRFYDTIICDEVTRTFKGNVVKMMIAIEALSGFMMAIIYEKSMTAPKFVQIMAHIKTCLCPHSMDATKITLRCDQATWHSSPGLVETLKLLNIEITFHNSTTNSKNIIPELDARIKIFSQYLVQLVESTPFSSATCCHLAAAKCNTAIGLNGYTPSELFVGRGWQNGNQIKIDVDRLIRGIKIRREARRLYEDRKNAKKVQKKEQQFVPYTDPRLNSPLVTTPELVQLKPNDLVTLKESFDKNEPRYTYRVDKIDFKKRIVYVYRESDIDVDQPKGKWLSFSIIDRVFPESINSCQTSFNQFDGYYEWSKNWSNFITDVTNVTDFTITSDIPSEHMFQYASAAFSIEPLTFQTPQYPNINQVILETKTEDNTENFIAPKDSPKILSD